MNTAKVSGICFSSDEERILFTSDASGIANAYEVIVRDQTQKQLTYSETDNVRAISYFPNDGRILIAKDPGNRENSVLCIVEPAGREIVLTPGDEVQTSFHCWSSDEQSFYISTNERDPRLIDVYRVNADTFERELIYEASEQYYLSGISQDEKYLLFLKTARKSDADIYLYDIRRAKMKCLTSHQGDVLNYAPVFNREATAIYYVTNKDSEFQYVQWLDLTTGETSCVERLWGDVAWTYFSPDFRHRLTFFNNNSTTLRVMKIHDMETGEVSILPGFSCQSITSALVSRSGRHLAFYANGDKSPANLWVYDFEAKASTQLTHSLNPSIDAEDLVESEIVSFRSFDGLNIPCLLWRPDGASSIDKVPALLWVHGGPGGRMAKGYKGRIQYLVNHGYAVLGLNYRGSSGFGRTFFDADHQKHGKEPLWDCVAAKEYLGRLDYVDSSRIGIIGASFGGYMSLAALAFHPDEFAVGVSICGLSNLVSFTQTLPKYWDAKRFYEKLGDPNTELDKLRSISPFFSADKIKRPLMILQGATDPRCPREQSDEMVAAMRRHGGKVEYLVYEDEAHGFRRRKNAIHAYEAILKFLNRHLSVVPLSSSATNRTRR